MVNLGGGGREGDTRDHWDQGRMRKSKIRPVGHQNIYICTNFANLGPTQGFGGDPSVCKKVLSVPAGKSDT